MSVCGTFCSHNYAYCVIVGIYYVHACIRCAYHQLLCV